jgi:ABC-type protease/lipase transport system fused ATPase/permease subunit
MNNPDMMRQLMESPVVSQLMSNPDIMRQMIMANPQMRDLMEVKSFLRSVDDLVISLRITYVSWYILIIIAEKPGGHAYVEQP